MKKDGHLLTVPVAYFLGAFILAVICLLYIFSLESQLNTTKVGYELKVYSLEKEVDSLKAELANVADKDAGARLDVNLNN